MKRNLTTSMIQRSLVALRAPRRGNILVLSAALLVMIMAFAAFTIDVGYISLTKTQLQSAVDAAALSAALELNPTGNQSTVAAKARASAVEVANMNRAGDQPTVYLNPKTDVELGKRTWDPISQTYSVEFGPDARPYNVVRVTARRTQVAGQDGNGASLITDRRLPLFFGPVIGQDKADLQVTSIASYQPRDMVLALDYSASMNDDSELSSIGTLGRATVENNIRQIWQDLGSPTYGTLAFQPGWATLAGQPASGNTPHIRVVWKGTSIEVTSTRTISQATLTFSNGSTQSFNTINALTQILLGTGGNSGRRIDIARIWSGNNNGETFTFDTANIRRALGLNNVTYPYPAGSWNTFIDYSNSPYYDPGTSGYQYRYGMLTLVNMWNQIYPEHHNVPDLWKTRQQPISALKSSVDMLLDYLKEVEADDRVGFSAYNSPTGHALLESALTFNVEQIRTLSRQRQAGHYSQYTNIGAGMRTARMELESNSRPAAVRMMVLMTDGVANRSSTNATPRQFALDEAALAKAAGIKVMTISLGAGADTALMQQIADLTGGKHFNVPGGSAEANEDALRVAFGEIAADRSLKLIRDDSR